MRYARFLRSIPEGEPVQGGVVTITRADDGQVVATATTDGDGHADISAHGAHGAVVVTTVKGSTFTDDSRAIPRIGSGNWYWLREVLKRTHGNGYLPYGQQFAATATGTNLSIGGGAVLLDGVLAVWYFSGATIATTTDGDRALVAKLTGSGIVQLADVAYADIAPATMVPLWRFMRGGGSISSLTFIGTPILYGIVNRHPTLHGVARLASGSTTDAGGEAVTGLSTTLALETDVAYRVEASVHGITRGREGAFAVEIDGNLSAYAANGDDVTVSLTNHHARDKTGGSCLVRAFARSDTALTDWVLQGTFGSFGSGTGPNFDTPQQVAVSPAVISLGALYVADAGNGRVVVLAPDGSYTTAITGLPGVTGVAADASGNIYVCYGAFWAKYDAGLVRQWVWATGGPTLRHVAVEPGGANIYVTASDNRVFQFDAATGTGPDAVWGSTGSANGQFKSPWGIATDGTHVYVSDTVNHRVQKFTTTGFYVAKWGSLGGDAGEFASPEGIALDADGDVWVADHANNRLQRFGSAGAWQATVAQASPTGVALASGDVLWASNNSGHNVAKWDETAAAFGFDALVLTARAVPRS